MSLVWKLPCVSVNLSNVNMLQVEKTPENKVLLALIQLYQSQHQYGRLNGGVDTIARYPASL